MVSLNGSLNGGSPNLKLSLANSSTLVKAVLIPWEPGIPKIEFMFNPTELAFECQVETKDNKGARSEKEGQPKVNFSHVNAEKITISKILFDTYESGDNVVEKYIQPFRKAVQFVGSGNETSSNFAIGGLPGPLQSAAGQVTGQVSKAMSQLSNPIEKPTSAPGGSSQPEEKADNRTPIYRFVWGEQVYLRRCFVERLSYKLTLFLPDGTPVRAVIDSLTLKKADDQNPSTDLQQAIVDRVKDGLQARVQAGGNLRF